MATGCCSGTKKKTPSCDEVLKGSLNLLVTKGPEETTEKSVDEMRYALSMSGFSLAVQSRDLKSGLDP